jgi:hypothetical protein
LQLPLFDPSSPDRLVPRDYHSVRLTAEELAAVDADLASSTFSTTAPAECAPSRHDLTLRLETVGAQIPEEGHVELVGTCLDVLRLAGNPFWWRPDASTLAVLARLLPAD